MMRGITGKQESEIQNELLVLRSEDKRLRAEVGRLSAALTEALEHIGELERKRRQPSSFVKPNRPWKEGEKHALVSNHPCRVLAIRIVRHQDELFPFVRYPGVPPDSNAAERALRPLVIMRRISGGSSSPEGSQTRLTLSSLFSTWAARDLNPFTHCISLMQVDNAPP